MKNSVWKTDKGLNAIRTKREENAPGGVTENLDKPRSADANNIACFGMNYEQNPEAQDEVNHKPSSFLYTPDSSELL